MSSIITLAEVAARTTHIIIACGTCRGRTRLQVDQLLRIHGPHMPMPELLRILARDCPRLDSWGITDRCDVYCPTLGELSGPNPA